ncbi:MAG: hypothetical protein HDR23_07605 [Lachnospiraceae bacterium]|nr:hypothetical protein [Lachnospiraceae bacterium]
MNTANLDSYCIGRVLRILDNRTIIVSTGNSVLTLGAQIQVYEIVDTVKDLEGNDLDILIHVKDTLEVIQVENNYSICQKMITRPITFNFALSPLLEHTTEEYVPLNIDNEDIQPLILKDPLIRVGDPIKFA